MKSKQPCLYKKRFLFWSYVTVEHDLEMVSIKKFSNISDDFIVKWKCKRCGMVKSQNFVQYDTLLKMGISSDDLNNVTT